MNFKSSILWCFSIILFFACKNSQQEINFIKGHAHHISSDSVKLQLLTFTSTKTLATTPINKDGNFLFESVIVKEPGIYGFRFDDNYWITILDSTAQNEIIEIDGSNKLYSSLKTSFKRGQDFLSVLKFIEGIHILQDSIYQSFEHHKFMHEETISFSDSIDLLVNKFIIKKIDAEKDPIALVYYIKWLDSTINFEFIGKKITHLKDTIPNSIYTKELVEKYELLKRAYQQGNSMKEQHFSNLGKQSIYPFDTVQIGNQTWMAENLNIATPNSWCLYDDPKNCALYGRLYNWYDALEACPVGWKLPTDEDWKALELFLGAKAEELEIETWRGSGVGGKLKAANDLWDEPNKGANNSTGFNALPGGPRNKFGMYGKFGHNATFWTATEQGKYQAIFRYLGYSRDDIARSDHSKLEGHSVRCIKSD